MASNFYLKKIKIDWFGHLAFNGEPEFKAGVNLLIGKNGSGKTSILQMIEASMAGRGASVGMNDEEIKNFQDKETVKIAFQTESGENSINYVNQGWQNAFILKDKLRFIVANRTIKNELTQNPFIQFANYAIPEPVHEINIADEFNKAIISELLNVIKKYRKESGESVANEIQEAYKLGLVDFDKDIQINFDRQNPVYFIDYRGKEVDILNLSAGEKEYLYFYSYLRRISDDENKIILIDEPELHLHGNQIRKLCELIENLSEKNQVMLATHSGDVLHYFLQDANLILLDKGKLSNPSVSSDLRKIITGMGMPIDPSFFTAYWICAENEPDKRLKGNNAPTTPEILEWLFGKDINKRFWSFGESRIRAEGAVKMLEDASTQSKDIKLSVIFDGDKLVRPSNNFPPKNVSNKKGVFYFPFWEIENIFISPAILDEVIEEKSGKKGFELFWEKLEEHKDRLFESFKKTNIKNEVRNLTNDNQFDGDSGKGLDELKNKFQELSFDEAKANGTFSKIMSEKNWKWIAGKEAITYVIELESNFWDKIRKLVDDNKVIDLIKKDSEIEEFLKNFD